MRVLLAQLNPTVGALEANTNRIIGALDEGRAKGADLVLFPELAIPGYPPEDLLLLSTFIDECDRQLERVIHASHNLIAVVGTLRRSSGAKPLHNSAAIIQDGQLLGFQDKTLLPTYDVFSEHRYFEPAGESPIWELGGERVAITICEDIWTGEGFEMLVDYLRDPVEERKQRNPTLHLNLSASPFSMGREQERLRVVQQAAEKLGVPTLYCNQVGGNDSLIFDGGSLVMTREGEVAAEACRFEEDLMLVETQELKPAKRSETDPLQLLFDALVLGLRDYFGKSGFERALIGISGGIDSALVAAIACAALGSHNVQGVAMPSRYSSSHSMQDAEQLAQNLDFGLVTIPIESVYSSMLELLGPHFQGKPADATEENLQARIRGMILMALSNKHGSIVLSTGNKSETAMGYCTLYGDMVGGLSVINDVPKMTVYELCRWLNREREVIPDHIIEKPPSAELSPNQLDSDALPDYSIVDAVLDDYVLRHESPTAIAAQRGLPLPLVQELVRKIHRTEYKRRQAAPGLRVSAKAFSVGRRFPIVHGWLP